MTNNVLDYIYVFLSLCLPVRFYKQFLDYLNNIYDIAKIKNLGYKDLDIFIPSIRGLNIIPKTIIFVDSINKRMIFIDYLYTKLLNNLKDKIK